MIERPLYTDLWARLSGFKSMLFLAGPRQSGKTTLAKALATRFANRLYYNYDHLDSKRILAVNPTFFTDIDRVDDSIPFIVFDELHKHPEWRNYLKGVVDEHGEDYRFLVSGSGRLDLFSRGGDSLAGRYLMFHLWPFTVAELTNGRRGFGEFWEDPLALPDASGEAADHWRQLVRCSGFPEPYVRASDDFHRLWSTTYLRQLVREDIRNEFHVRQVDKMETLMALLPERVGSPLSVNALSKILGVAFDTTKTWLALFERFFLTFSVKPWSKAISRAIRKETKAYLFDYATIQEAGARFENMVAMELFRAISHWNDSGQGQFGLRYVRNKSGQEVDFLLTRDERPQFLVECKLGDETPGKALLKFQSLLQVPAIQLVESEGICRTKMNGDHRLLVVTASRWLKSLP